jgi:hypothetical protein
VCLLALSHPLLLCGVMRWKETNFFGDVCRCVFPVWKCPADSLAFLSSPVHQVFHTNQTGVVPLCCCHYSRINTDVAAHRCGVCHPRSGLHYCEARGPLHMYVLILPGQLDTTPQYVQATCVSCTPIGSVICSIALSLYQTCVCFTPSFSPKYMREHMGLLYKLPECWRCFFP